MTNLIIHRDNIVESHNLISNSFTSNCLYHNIDKVGLLCRIVVVVENLMFKLVCFKNNGKRLFVKSVNNGFVPSVGVHISSHLEYFHKLTLIYLFCIFSLSKFFFFSLYLILSGIAFKIIEIGDIVNRGVRADLDCSNLSVPVIVPGSHCKHIMKVVKLFCIKFGFFTFPFSVILEDRQCKINSVLKENIPI